MSELIAAKGTEIRDDSGDLVVTIAEDIFRQSRPTVKSFILADGSHPIPGTLMPAALVAYINERVA